jgi:biopolymer transport protein ExbB/TolQ
MNLSEWLQRIMVSFGASWVMWLLLGLSVVSVAIILERAWFYWSLHDDLAILARDLRSTLEDSVEAAKRRMDASPSAEAAVVSAGLAMANKGPDAAEEAMAGAAALQKMKLEKRLAYLGTLGNNAPFIGLFGTVIGVVGAFDALGQAAKQPLAQAASQALAPQTVMSSIAEALVATAVGLAVAIPAVAANNFFQRTIKSMLANTDALARVLMAHLKSDPDYAAAHASELLSDRPSSRAASKPAAKGNGGGGGKSSSSRKPAKPEPARDEREDGEDDDAGEENA